MKFDGKPSRILRFAELKKKTGLSKANIDRMEKCGKFCARVQLSTRAVGWLSHEVDDWIEARARSRKERKYD